MDRFIVHEGDLYNNQIYLLNGHALADCSKMGGTFFDKTGKCYVLSSDKADWNQGRLNCQKQKNGDLASMPDEETMNFIKNNVGIEFSTSTWFGGKKESGGNWQWVDGSNWFYTHWDSVEGDPDVVGDAFIYIFKGNWRDASGSTPLPYICQY